MYKMFLVIGLLVNFVSAQASNCIDSKTKLNVCAMGEEVAILMRPELPKQLTQTMYIESVVAFYNSVTLRAVLQYDKNYLAAVYKENGLALSYGKKVMGNAAHGMCQAPETKEYIDAGGIVIYNYVFQDFELFTQVRVTSKSCKNRE